MLTFFAYGPEADSAAGSGLLNFLILALMIGAIFYFLMVRPQRTRMRRQQELISSIDVGDEVQTIGGIFGVIEHMDDESAVIQVEGGGRLRIVRQALARKVSP